MAIFLAMEMAFIPMLRTILGGFIPKWFDLNGMIHLFIFD